MFHIGSRDIYFCALLQGTPSAPQMQDLIDYLDSAHSCVQMDLEDRNWHLMSGIPNEAGWYFISTDAPLEVLSAQVLEPTHYQKKRSGKWAPVKSYDLRARAGRCTPQLKKYFSDRAVYSGLASELQTRAREHCFPDPGTGALALANYEALRSYQWVFHFVTLKRFMADCGCKEFVLRLGEQLWRAKYGWPVLCAH